MLPNPTTSLDEAKTYIDQYGYCIVQDVLNPQMVTSLRQRLFDQIAAEESLGITHHLPDKKQLVMFLLNKGTIFQDVILNQDLHEIVKHVLGDNYLLSAYHAHLAHPGGKTAFHTDQFWMPLPTGENKKNTRKSRFDHTGRKPWTSCGR